LIFRQFMETDAIIGQEMFWRGRVNASGLIRVWFGFLGSLAVIHSIRGKGTYRWGRSGKGPPMNPRIGRICEAIIGLGFMLGAILTSGS